MEGTFRFYCINLRSRQDRWKRFSEQPEVQKIMRDYPFERIEAVNGASLDIEKDNRISLRTKRNIKNHSRRDHEEINSAGAIGCYLSHMAAWKKFQDSGETIGIIFEDDAIIEEGFVEKLRAAMRDTTLLPRTPDLWKFSPPHDIQHIYEAKGIPIPKYNTGANVGPWLVTPFSLGTGYLLTKRGAGALLEHALPIDIHVDHYMYLCSYLGYLFSVFHKNIESRQYKLKRYDTDIHVSQECPICELPSNFPQRGIMAVNMPAMGIGLAVVGVLWWLGHGRRGGRR